MRFAALRAGLLPERIDLTLVGSLAAVGAVLGGLAARIARDLGVDVEVERGAFEGAFWGGLIGLAFVLGSQIDA